MLHLQNCVKIRNMAMAMMLYCMTKINLVGVEIQRLTNSINKNEKIIGKLVLQWRCKYE